MTTEAGRDTNLDCFQPLALIKGVHVELSTHGVGVVHLTTDPQLINDKAYLDKVLLEGAAKARSMGKPYLAAARKATGID